jgi:hypothetical protein
MSDAVAVQTPVRATVESITEAAGVYSSLKTNTRAEKMKYLQAVNSAKSLNDLATEAGKDGFAVRVVDIVLQEVDIANENTGELESGIRTTLVAEDGEAYYATSKGIAQSLKQVLHPSMFGTPDTWEEPLEVRAVREKGRNGFFFLTLKYV